MESETTLPATSPAKPEAQSAARQPVEHDVITLPSGASRLHLRVEVPAESGLQVDIDAFLEDGSLLDSRSLTFSSAAAAPAALELARSERRAWAETLPLWLMWLSLGIYAFVRLVALPSFPIYFFTDVAVQTVLAADFLRDRFGSYTGEFLPTFFENGSQYNLSTSVYLQILPYFLLGKSIWVTRGAAALVTLLAAFGVGLILKKVFKSPYPWLAVLLLSITPAWFLHSRTAFETGLATTFYAVFLYAYLMYLEGNTRFLYAAVISGALAFYTYTPMRMIMLVSALLLFVSDFRYHWQHRGVVLRGLGLAVLLALPFARFYINHPDASAWHLRLLNSYWLANAPLLEKLSTYLQKYASGLDPFYWYFPHQQDLARHTMPGYGHLLRLTMPLGLLGLALAIYHFRRPAYRALLAAVLAAPSGAALVDLGITRALVMVIPMAVLTALGASALLEWLHRRKRISRTLMATTVFIILAGGNLYMLGDALANGPHWHQDYGLAGMQWGAQQLFGEVKTYLRENPETKMIVSPSWANGTDVIARFFFDDPLPFEMGNANRFYTSLQPLDENTLFVLTPEEYETIPPEKFAEIKVEKTLPYPDGRPGFYFVRLRYADNIEEILAAEKIARTQLQIERLIIDGELVAVGYTQLDMGEIAHVFDGDPGTLIRTFAINPMQITLDFAQPRAMSSICFHIGGTPAAIHLKVWQAGNDSPVVITQQFAETPHPRDAVINFDSTMQVNRISAEIYNSADPPDGHVHLWEITYQ